MYEELRIKKKHIFPLRESGVEANRCKLYSIFFDNER